jgi:nicotinate phosphoribosyltransferase
MPQRALFTDLYQLTIAAGYLAAGRHQRTATFELFIRRLPPSRAFVVAAGLETALEYIRSLRFTPDEIDWLRTIPALRRAPAGFFDCLANLRFTGDVWAMAEGTPFFPQEPLLRVSAPLVEAQLLETTLLSIINFQTSIASKAARLVAAAGTTPVMEFGARRAHGPDAALDAARAAYIGGCASTSLVEAGRRFDIPLSGTMAHSWVLSASSESAAFAEFMDAFKEESVLLLDTYDTLAAARAVATSGLRPAGVRLDSGDFLALSRATREILDGAGLRSTRILVSGDLNEHRIRDLVAARAPIDAFAVGTALVTSEDAPALGGIYKLVQIEDTHGVRDVMKHSTGKATWPGRKQVYRIADRRCAVRDVVAFDDEIVDGRPLLEQVIAGGERTRPPQPLSEIRARARDLIAELPARLLDIEALPSYEVVPSTRLAQATRPSK